MRRALSLLALLVAIAISALCVRLGLWQLSRWHEKRAQVTESAARMSAPVRELTGSHALDPSLSGAPVRATGTFEDSCHVLLAGRIELGEPGVGLLSVLALRDGGRLLVDRGWLPALDARDADIRPFLTSGEQSVFGILEPIETNDRRFEWLALEGDGPKRWSVGRLAAHGVHEHLGRSLALYRLVELPGAGAPALPKRTSPVPPDAGMHLSYAFQWFLFAAGTLGAGVFITFRERSNSEVTVPRAS